MEVLLPSRIHLCVVRKVEVTAGKPHPALVQVGYHLAAVLEVLNRAEAEERRRRVRVLIEAGSRARCGSVKAGDFPGDRALAPERVDSPEVSGDGRGSRGL